MLINSKVQIEKFGCKKLQGSPPRALGFLVEILKGIWVGENFRKIENFRNFSKVSKRWEMVRNCVFMLLGGGLVRFGVRFGSVGWVLRLRRKRR